MNPRNIQSIKIPCKKDGDKMVCEIASVTLESDKWEKYTNLYAIDPSDKDKIKTIFNGFNQDDHPLDRFKEFEKIAPKQGITVVKISPVLDMEIDYDDLK